MSEYTFEQNGNRDDGWIKAPDGRIISTLSKKDTSLVMVALLNTELETLRQRNDTLQADNARLRDAAKWVLYATIHGISKSGEDASQTEQEAAIKALEDAIDMKPVEQKTYVTVSPEAKERLMRDYGLAETDFVPAPDTGNTAQAEWVVVPHPMFGDQYAIYNTIKQEYKPNHLGFIELYGRETKAQARADELNAQESED